MRNNIQYDKIYKKAEKLKPLEFVVVTCLKNGVDRDNQIKAVYSTLARRSHKWRYSVTKFDPGHAGPKRLPENSFAITNLGKRK